jgi:hypothetical protein
VEKKPVAMPQSNMLFKNQGDLTYMPNYSHNHGMSYCCDHLKLHWDYTLAERTDMLCQQEGLTQGQFNLIVVEYAYQVYTLFHPRTYSYWQRIKFAFHFLRPFHKHIKK